jgi:hypothetical protein
MNWAITVWVFVKLEVRRKDENDKSINVFSH